MLAIISSATDLTQDLPTEYASITLATHHVSSNEVIGYKQDKYCQESSTREVWLLKANMCVCVCVCVRVCIYIKPEKRTSMNTSTKTSVFYVALKPKKYTYELLRVNYIIYIYTSYMFRPHLWPSSGRCIKKDGHKCCRNIQQAYFVYNII